MTDFNAKASRAKRPCPMWVDAFQRDTQHLEADEIGAYFLIIMAMWTRESCDLPDDDSRLSRIARVSLRLWKSRVGPTIRAFLLTEPGIVISKRLREEAAYVESEVQKQSDRKRGSYAKPQGMSDSSGENDEKDGKPLKDNEPPSTVDITMDTTPVVSFLQPNNLQEEGSVVLLRADPRGQNLQSENPAAGFEEPSTPPPQMPADADKLYDDVLMAAGLARGQMIPAGWLPPAATYHIIRWRGLGLSDIDIVEGARSSRSRFADPPGHPKAFDHVMRQIATAKQHPPLTVPKSDGGRLAIQDQRSEHNRSAKSEREARIMAAAVRGST